MYNAARMSHARVLPLAVALVALSVFVTPRTRELFVGDETKYAQVVREMRAGAFFLPTLNGTPFTHKPPLHFWMVDALTYVFGVYSTWSFVLPSILGFLGLLWLMWRMEGPVASFVCGTALLVWGSAQTARMDVTFTLAMAFAFWMLERAWSSEARGLRPEAFVAGVALGIATLIKGPMAPVMAIFLFLFEWLRRESVPRARYALAVMAMVVIPLLWFVPAMVMGGGGYTHEVLVKQTAGRAVGAWVHRSPLWFYFVHAPATLFPWFLLLILAIVAAYKRNDERAKFYMSWVLAVVVPYSLMSSKLDVYMMAMIPAMALLVGRLFALEDVWLRRAWIANVIMLTVLFAAAIGGRFAPLKYEGTLTILTALAAATLAALLVSLVIRTPLASTLSLGFVAIAVLLFAGLFMMPLINELASDRPIVRAVVAQHVPAEEIALYASPQLWTHDMPRQLERVRYVSPEILRAQPATVVVTSRSHANEIADVLRGYRKAGEFRMIGKPFDVYRR